MLAQTSLENDSSFSRFSKMPTLLWAHKSLQNLQAKNIPRYVSPSVGCTPLAKSGDPLVASIQPFITPPFSTRARRRKPQRHLTQVRQQIQLTQQIQVIQRTQSCPIARTSEP